MRAGRRGRRPLRSVKKPLPGGRSGKGVRDVVTVNPYELTAVVLMAMWAGMQIGRLLTLWQVESKNSNDQGNQGND